MRLTTRVATVIAAFIALATISAPAFAQRSHATGTAVTVTSTEFKFKLSKTSAPAGSVTFTLSNKGSIGHDFKIAGKKTAVIGHGKTAKLTVTLKKGKYAYSCTVPGHAAAGMKGVFTVK
jgi:iron uptake system component EfeO